MVGDISALCSWMETACLVWSLGYDQGNRWDIRDGGECDCSSLMIWALRKAGFDVGSATYTGDLSANLTARGWKRIKPDGTPIKGDILLNDRDHVALYIGNGKVAQASIDEHGNITGGKSGDQTGRETNVCSYYDFPWNCYLRYTGAAAKPVKVAEIKYRVSIDERGKTWRGEVEGADGFAGKRGSAIRWLAMDFPGWYQVKTRKSGWLPRVSAYDVKDLENGCAGDGSPIIGVRCYYDTPDPAHTGYYAIDYQVSALSGAWLPVVRDAEDYAGNGKSIDRFRARLVKV